MVTIPNNMIPTENELGFLEVAGIMDLKLEVRILAAVFMILAHATTNSAALINCIASFSSTSAAILVKSCS